MISSDQTVADIVLEHSACAEVFKRHRIDFCCRGDLSLAEAARSRGLDVDTLIDALQSAVEARADRPAGLDPRTLSTEALTTYITETHHGYLRGALPFIREMATKVARVHGEHNPKLNDLASAVLAIHEALLRHLDVEERELFPQLVAADGNPDAMREGLGAMHDDHLEVAALLSRVRQAADDFTLPPWACRSYRALFSELEVLERNTFAHVHLENHVLSPRFVATTVGRA